MGQDEERRLGKREDTDPEIKHRERYGVDYESLMVFETKKPSKKASKIRERHRADNRPFEIQIQEKEAARYC